ncbi:MAG: D-glycero-alpha-D-manno-heptose-7-phosphate kinase [Candidatus Azotimanducaceae bacterium]|jgi:D-glycero-alpha-D-manno-heptose-7-phosphate kinase
MIISRTPVRMSFVGGGSDMASFYEQSPGAVLSTTINKYIYVTLNPKFDGGIRVGYSRNEDVKTLEEVEHPIVRNTLGMMGCPSGVEITTIADVPSKGTGLGSSSTFTVGLLNAVSAYQGRGRGKKWLARKACEVEIDLCGEPIGKQDQYAAAYGGFNVFEFLSDGKVRTTPVMMSQDTCKRLHENVMLFYTGITRSASSILAAQSTEMSGKKEKFDVMCEMVKQVPVLKDVLESGNLDDFGRILHEAWLMKRSLVKGISNSSFDDMYAAARNAGATGGKILGAGAGGFLMVYAERDKQDAVAAALSDLKQVDIKFDNLGSQIICNYQ